MAAASRTADDRANETRAADKRPIPEVVYTGRFFTNKKNWPSDMEYRWIRETLFNQPDNGRLQQAVDEGYTAVPATRHPEMTGRLITGETSGDSVIRRGGQILCERPKRVAKAMREALRRANYETMKNIAWATDGLQDAPRLTDADQVGIQTTRSSADFKD